MKFKVGDKVIKRNGENFSNGGKFATIESIHEDLIWFLETSSWYSIINAENKLELLDNIQNKTTLSKLSTKDLVQELQRREGVISTEVGNEEMFRITTVDFNGNVKHKIGNSSPCVILEIFD